MSKRRQPGEIIKRCAGSGFVASPEPDLLQVPSQPIYDREATFCMLDCGDRKCREWANLEIVTNDGLGTGHFMYHISECEMFDRDK